jgi:hypothetical protein
MKTSASFTPEMGQFLERSGDASRVSASSDKRLSNLLRGAE